MSRIKIMNKVINYLNLREVGLLELLLASTQMLSGYSLAGIPLMLLMWVLMISVVILRGKFRFRPYKPMLVLALYWFVHETAILLIDNTNINSLIGQIIYFTGFFCLYSQLDVKKLRGTFNWIAIISIAGLLYQWSLVLNGGLVHPLEIPGLGMPEGRFEQEIPRPSGFYMEPAAVVSFMVIPLMFAMIDRKYLWMTIMILSIFLTTSTTGIIGVFIMMIASLFIQKRISKSSIVIILLGGLLVYVLLNSSFFEMGVDKLVATDGGSNEHRLEQGVYVVSTMHPTEMIFGVPYSSSAHYCLAGRAPNVAVYGSGEDASVYVSTFWELLLRFGIVGLIIYLGIYLNIFRKSRKVWPLLAFMIAVMFSNPDNMGINYMVCLLVMLSVCNEEPQALKDKGITM